MTRRYYSSRNKQSTLSVDDLYLKFKNLYLFFREKDYFKNKAGITSTHLTDAIKYKLAFVLNFEPFPIGEWDDSQKTEDNIFDCIEFFYDHVSKPGEWDYLTDETGYNYTDYVSYDDKAGREEFRSNANSFLCDYKNGYELSEDGMILALGEDGLNYILDVGIIPYDQINVDDKVKNAILKWRNRQINIDEKREAIRELADVFEWLKDTGKLSQVMNKKDESAIFNIANNFHIRHHNQRQKRNYDEKIWLSWMFHFYLATYHAVIRLLKKQT